MLVGAESDILNYISRATDSAGLLTELIHTRLSSALLSETLQKTINRQPQPSQIVSNDHYKLRGGFNQKN